MADPLLAPALKLTDKELFPAFTLLTLGAPGAAAGVTDMAVDAEPSPFAFTAKILIE